MSFCSQRDILFEDLSVEEHLEYVGRMRTMRPTAEVDCEVKRVIVQLGL